MVLPDRVTYYCLLSQGFISSLNHFPNHYMYILMVDGVIIFEGYPARVNSLVKYFVILPSMQGCVKI